MPVIIKPVSQIKVKLGIDPNGRVQKEFTKRCREYMDEFVPMDEGTLRTVVDIQPTWITYEMPYARYQYYGQREDGTHKVVKYTTPGTGSYWDRRMVSARINDLVKEMQDYMGGN